MNLFEAIRGRRSIRKFLAKEVPDEFLKKIIDAGRRAPFGGSPIPDCQLCEYIIIKDKETKKKLALHYKDRQYITQAPVIIAVCADTSRDTDYKDWDITCALAIENIILAIHSLGLATCFNTCFGHHEKHKEDKKKLREALNLPDNVELITILPVGYQDPNYTPEKKVLRDFKEITHYEKW